MAAEVGLNSRHLIQRERSGHSCWPPAPMAHCDSPVTPALMRTRRPTGHSPPSDSTGARSASDFVTGSVQCLISAGVAVTLVISPQSARSRLYYLPLRRTGETGPRIPGAPVSSFPRPLGAFRARGDRSPPTAVCGGGFRATLALEDAQMRFEATAAGVCHTATSVSDPLAFVPGRISPTGSRLGRHNQPGLPVGRAAPELHRGHNARRRRCEVQRPSRRQKGPAGSHRPRREIPPPQSQFLDDYSYPVGQMNACAIRQRQPPWTSAQHGGRCWQAEVAQTSGQIGCARPVSLGWRGKIRRFTRSPTAENEEGPTQPIDTGSVGPSSQAHPAGVEPATFGSVDRCSIH